MNRFYAVLLHCYPAFITCGAFFIFSICVYYWLTNQSVKTGTLDHIWRINYSFGSFAVLEKKPKIVLKNYHFCKKKTQVIKLCLIFKFQLRIPLSTFLKMVFQDGLNSNISVVLPIITKGERHSSILCFRNGCVLCIKIGLTFLLVFGAQLVKTLIFDLDISKHEIG